jgi:hypothetical protein
MLNLVLGVCDVVGRLANTRVRSYLYPREIKKVTKGFVLLLHQPDRKLGMTWQCVNLDMVSHFLNFLVMCNPSTN